MRFAPHKLTNCQLWHGQRGIGFSPFPTTLQGSPKPPPLNVQCLSCRGRRQGAAGCTVGQTWRAPGRAQATPCPSDVPLPLAQSLLGLPDLQAPPRTCLGPGRQAAYRRRVRQRKTVAAPLRRLLTCSGLLGVAEVQRDHTKRSRRSTGSLALQAGSWRKNLARVPPPKWLLASTPQGRHPLPLLKRRPRVLVLILTYGGPARKHGH